MLAMAIMLWAINMECAARKIHEDAGTRGAQILKISVGAKAVGMGESYVAAADDVYASYWNPAGLIHVESNQLGFMHNEWFEDIRYEFLGYVHPIGDLGTLAGSVSYVSMGELDKTDEDGNSEGQFHPYDILLGLSFGKRLNDSISIGVNAKFLQEKIDEEKAQAFALDLGGLYFVPGSGLILGLNVQHLGSKMKFIEESFSLPLNVKVGAAYRLIDGALTFATDVNQPTDGDMNMGMGVEYKIMGVLNLRSGYRYTVGGNDLGTASGLRAGIGIEFRDYKLDYAFVPYGELGQAHRISLLANF
jgi:hypothetical protein